MPPIPNRTKTKVSHLLMLIASEMEFMKYETEFMKYETTIIKKKSISFKDIKNVTEPMPFRR